GAGVAEGKTRAPVGRGGDDDDAGRGDRAEEVRPVVLRVLGARPIPPHERSDEGEVAGVHEEAARSDRSPGADGRGLLEGERRRRRGSVRSGAGARQGVPGIARQALIMCLLLLLHRTAPGWPIVVGANRDEDLERESLPPIRWPGSPEFFAPVDVREAGTW